MEVGVEPSSASAPAGDGSSLEAIVVALVVVVDENLPVKSMNARGVQVDLLDLRASLRWASAGLGWEATDSSDALRGISKWSMEAVGVDSPEREALGRPIKRNRADGLGDLEDGGEALPWLEGVRR